MYYQNETDETLVLLTLAGEQRAYEALVVRHQKAVVASAIAVTKSRFMAEDAAQDAFVTAWMKLNTLQETQKFGQWVCRIAKNCALNMLTRYRSFLPLDTVDNLDLGNDRQLNPAELYALSEERKEVNKSVEGLPEKVRKIIHLHYFEGLSIAEIADRMRISEGTVKWQLHDGRKRIRKELCAMNEKYTDTLVQRVMKKVEELKLWQLRNDKTGFEAVYKDVLKEVEDLPECRDKHHALADVLMRGWWWLPGEKNNALFARIADAAMEGKNEEVMAFIVAREDYEVYGGARIDFIRDKQIPRLEKAGFVKTLGREWFWLGYDCFREGKPEEGKAAYDKVVEILKPGDLHYALVPFARKTEDRLAEHYKSVAKTRYNVSASAEEYRYIDGALCRWSDELAGDGWIQSVDREAFQIFMNASKCDCRFFANIAVGETFTGSDGTTLTYQSSSETVDTPAGRFENCQLWVTEQWDYSGKDVFKSYYKEGVGIVRQEHTNVGVTEARVLKAYTIKGGKGLLPFAQGNTWEYESEHDPAYVACQLCFTVSYADEKRVVLAAYSEAERLQYNENSWLDMIQKIRNEYFVNRKVCDIYPAIERAEALAVTPMEKAHTKAAASAARRILSTHQPFNPDCTATGHWNFFEMIPVRQKKETTRITHNNRWSFELKHTGFGVAETPILYNDVLGILQDAANCIWSEEWRVGASPIVEYTKWDNNIKTQITCEEGGTITTKAGAFENCLKLSLDISGMGDGWEYRGGKKVYYFAEGVGIVRTENEFCGGAKTAVYELTAYEGTAEGYMPMADGLMRRYDALDLTDGYVGASEYTYVADESGDIVIFSDRTGIKQILPPVTDYCSIFSEVQEQKVWDANKWQEGHAMHAVNNLKLLTYYLERPTRNRMDAKRSVGIQGFKMNLIRLLGGGEVPPAWYGTYTWSALVQAAALFGNKEKEAGYAALEETLIYLEKWLSLEDGAELPAGDEIVLGGAKYVKGKQYFVYPDGKREHAGYQITELGSDFMYYCITASSGWEWFNSVREEDRFKEYIDRAKDLADKYK